MYLLFVPVNQISPFWGVIVLHITAVNLLLLLGLLIEELFNTEKGRKVTAQMKASKFSGTGHLAGLDGY